MARRCSMSGKELESVKHLLLHCVVARVFQDLLVLC